MGIFSNRRSAYGGDEYRIWNGGSTSWSLSSKKDPRFRASGGATGLFDAEAQMNAWILAKAKELGVEPPDDIEIGAWKS